ncbi:cupin domain-containing protein [Bacteroides thetaiotaomicron]|uniref:cupin domain-containing protein n=1 Tax=Bacteroides thetaiotaomicron TaxID=818 RepID=UPI001C021AC8|nr:cupin domain-containing protein [Bacteroides thetaiotaomicron]MBT9900039.1 cupin domain-containing protein [Bacteroides thetaiotaomicron]
MEQSFKKGTVLHLASLIEYSEGGVISKQLIKSPAGNITLFSFDKGEGLSEHRAPFDALVQILEGTAHIVVNGTPFTVKAGESIVFPANAPHALTAVEKFKMLLTMIKE